MRYSVGIFLQNHFCIKELIDKCNAEAWSECVNYASIWRFGQQSEKDVIIDLLLEKQKIPVPSKQFGWSTDRPLLHMCVICRVWWINGTVADLSFTNELSFVFGLWLELMEKACILWDAFISSVSDCQSENELKEYSGLLVICSVFWYNIKN